MASLNYNCSVRQGFNFEKDRQVLVGHLVSLNIGGTELAADMTVTVPTDYSSASIVGLISDIDWRGGYADQINIASVVSTENQKAVSILTHTNLSSNKVVFKFNIYAYDQNAKVYYLAFNQTETALNGLIYKNNGELSLQIASDPDRQVVSPLNFPLYIGIMPQESAQTIKVAVSNTDKFVKSWGVTVGGT